MTASDTPHNAPGSGMLAGTSLNGKRRRISDQTIYDSIYEAVLSQRLPPGTKLLESALTELFGVSRSVVRKALTRLASDHVIEQRHSQVATVSKPSVEETRHVFEARIAVEGEMVRLLAGRLSKAQLRTLRGLVTEENHAHDNGNLQGRSLHGMRLHLFLADCCPNTVLGDIQRGLVLRTSIAVSLYKATGTSSCYLGDDHARLVDLIEQGAGDEAAALARQHLGTLASLMDLDQDTGIDLASVLRIQD